MVPSVVQSSLLPISPLSSASKMRRDPSWVNLSGSEFSRRTDVLHMLVPAGVRPDPELVAVGPVVGLEEDLCTEAGEVRRRSCRRWEMFATWTVVTPSERNTCAVDPLLAVK